MLAQDALAEADRLCGATSRFLFQSARDNDKGKEEAEQHPAFQPRVRKALNNEERAILQQIAERAAGPLGRAWHNLTYDQFYNALQHGMLFCCVVCGAL
jgi:hypothetical protein